METWTPADDAALSRYADTIKGDTDGLTIDWEWSKQARQLSAEDFRFVAVILIGPALGWVARKLLHAVATVAAVAGILLVGYCGYLVVAGAVAGL